MHDDKDNEQIMVVTNPDGMVVLAGQPRKLTASECREYLKPGWNVTVMTFKDYKEANFEWAYDKK
jgi:hypothetical protein